ncbi:MAG: S-adenosylmethionine:tRNA ribosyltransferase-isomerase [Gammaproteobacteria bacterium]|nr:MAG: S-adenosylmethionine:tRNA ribosyltransferase-isomerase [Gammaproteobacteria bacterium]
MRRKDFSYELPEELIAQAPLPERSASRMLVLDGGSGALTDSAVRELPRFLEPGDLLVFNDTRVVAARLAGVKPSGGRVEILLERALAGPEALAQLSASKPIRAGLEVRTAGGTVRVMAREDELWRIALPAPALEFFERFGAVPLPPYIRRAPDALDRDCAWITLHVGAGTFQPLRTDDIASHTMHAERASVSAATVDAIARTRAAGGRVVAVGTTVMRALESAALPAGGEPAPGKHRTEPALAPWAGDTRLYITPGFHFRVSDVLLTNFHLPESTLLILVCAFAGRHRTLAAYEHAVRGRYRFFSYGDAMLITRGSA